MKLRKFVKVKNVNVVSGNNAWLSPFKRSNNPVNTTSSFRKRYLNWMHLRVVIKRKISFMFCTSLRCWDEDTFEPPMAYYVGINWKNINFELSVAFNFCDLHLKRTNSVLYAEKVSLTDKCFDWNVEFMRLIIPFHNVTLYARRQKGLRSWVIDFSVFTRSSISMSQLCYLGPEPSLSCQFETLLKRKKRLHFRFKCCNVPWLWSFLK